LMYAEDNADADICNEQVKHTLIIRWHTMWYAHRCYELVKRYQYMNTIWDMSIPISMFLFPMQFVGKSLSIFKICTLWYTLRSYAMV